MEELIMHNGQRKQVEALLARRKSKKSYEYEVQVRLKGHATHSQGLAARGGVSSLLWKCAALVDDPRSDVSAFPLPAGRRLHVWCPSAGVRGCWTLASHGSWCAPVRVQWVGLKSVFNSWLSRELLEDLGFEKLVHDIDAKEVARLGVYGRPLTIPGVQAHFDDFGLESEFATYGQIKNLSGRLPDPCLSLPDICILRHLGSSELGAVPGLLDACELAPSIEQRPWRSVL